MKLVIFPRDWHDGPGELIVNAEQVAGMIPDGEKDRTALIMATDDKIIVDRNWIEVMERLVHGPFNQVPSKKVKDEAES